MSKLQPTQRSNIPHQPSNSLLSLHLAQGTNQTAFSNLLLTFTGGGGESSGAWGDAHGVCVGWEKKKILN